MNPEDNIRALRDNARWRTRLVARPVKSAQRTNWAGWLTPVVSAVVIAALFFVGAQLVRGLADGDGSVAPPPAASSPMYTSSREPSATPPSPPATPLSSPTPTSTPNAEEPSNTPPPTSGNSAQVPDEWRVPVTEANPLGLPSINDYPDSFNAQHRLSRANNFGYIFAYDSGSAPGATGETRFDADGHPVSYRVAAGDVADLVAARFGVVSLFSFNCARRSLPDLYAGDIINLSPYTVATVGDENGSSTPVSPEAAEACLASTGLPKQVDPK